MTFGKSKEAFLKIVLLNKNYNLTTKKVYKKLELFYKTLLIKSYSILKEHMQQENTISSKKRENLRILFKSMNFTLKIAFSNLTSYFNNSQESENKFISNTTIFTEKLNNLLTKRFCLHFSRIKYFSSLTTYRLYILSLVRWKFANIEAKHHTAKTKCFHLVNMVYILENYIQNQKYYALNEMQEQQEDFNKLKLISKRFLAKTLQNQSNCFESLKNMASSSRLFSNSKK